MPATTVPTEIEDIPNNVNDYQLHLSNQLRHHLSVLQRRSDEEQQNKKMIPLKRRRPFDSQSLSEARKLPDQYEHTSIRNTIYSCDIISSSTELNQCSVTEKTNKAGVLSESLQISQQINEETISRCDNASTPENPEYEGPQSQPRKALLRSEPEISDVVALEMMVQEQQARLQNKKILAKKLLDNRDQCSSVANSDQCKHLADPSRIIPGHQPTTMGVTHQQAGADSTETRGELEEKLQLLSIGFPDNIDAFSFTNQANISYSQKVLLSNHGKSLLNIQAGSNSDTDIQPGKIQDYLGMNAVSPLLDFQTAEKSPFPQKIIATEQIDTEKSLVSEFKGDPHVLSTVQENRFCLNINSSQSSTCFWKSTLTKLKNREKPVPIIKDLFGQLGAKYFFRGGIFQKTNTTFFNGGIFHLQSASIISHHENRTALGIHYAKETYHIQDSLRLGQIAGSLKIGKWMYNSSKLLGASVCKYGQGSKVGFGPKNYHYITAQMPTNVSGKKQIKQFSGQITPTQNSSLPTAKEWKMGKINSPNAENKRSGKPLSQEPALESSPNSVSPGTTLKTGAKDKQFTTTKIKLYVCKPEMPNERCQRVEKTVFKTFEVRLSMDEQGQQENQKATGKKGPSQSRPHENNGKKKKNEHSFSNTQVPSEPSLKDPHFTTTKISLYFCKPGLSEEQCQRVEKLLSKNFPAQRQQKEKPDSQFASTETVPDPDPNNTMVGNFTVMYDRVVIVLFGILIILAVIALRKHLMRRLQPPAASTTPARRRRRRPVQLDAQLLDQNPHFDQQTIRNCAGRPFNEAANQDYCKELKDGMNVITPQRFHGREDPKICTICMENEKQVCFIPCGHLFCHECASKANSTCFVCQQPFHNLQRIFL